MSHIEPLLQKSQFSTRIVMGCLSPVFEETTTLLVDANAAKVNERVSLQIWDSDRFTVDDMIGHVEVDIVGESTSLLDSERRLTIL